jgi:hypothetical protein
VIDLASIALCPAVDFPMSARWIQVLKAVLGLTAVMLLTGCALNPFHRGQESVITVQGAIVGVPRDAACELSVLTTNGKRVETLHIVPTFDRSVTLAPRARRAFEVSCAGYPGKFKSRAYKSSGWTEVDLGTIFLTATGTDVALRR